MSVLQVEEYSGDGYLVQFVASGPIGGADTDCAGADVPGWGGSHDVKKRGMSVELYHSPQTILVGGAMSA